MNNMKKTSPSRNSTERHDFVNHDDHDHHDDHDKTENSLGVIRSQMDVSFQQQNWAVVFYRVFFAYIVLFHPTIYTISRPF